MDAVTPAAVMAFTETCIRARRPAVVANHNLHSLYWLRREPEMAAFYAAADLIEVDSRPLIAWGRLLGRRPAWASVRRPLCANVGPAWRSVFATVSST
jgi:N-acetylglucosaminyldiphosphoundecaprenol N-acetyl-beta-D-mannosaminyltransferase